MRSGGNMNTEQELASQAASLRAGVAATVMIVIVCFGVALAFSDWSPVSETIAATQSHSAGAEMLHAVR